MMNELTNWDEYSDYSDEEDLESPFSPPIVNETTQKLLLRKYSLLVKEALTDKELSEIMAECKYKDEEIRRKIEEKLTSQKQNKDWKAKDRKWEAKPNPKKPEVKMGLNPTSPSPLIFNNVNIPANYYTNLRNMAAFSNYVSNVNNRMPVNTISNNTGKSNFAGNLTKSDVSSGSGSTPFEAMTKLGNKPTKANESSLQVDGAAGLEDEVVDQYFAAALKINTNKHIPNVPSVPSVSSVTSVANTCDNSNIDNKPLILTCINNSGMCNGLVSTKQDTTNQTKLSSQDIKEFVDELKKNRALIRRKSSPIKEELNITTKKEEEEALRIDYDLTKIPTFLNANSYSNYFYQTGDNSKKPVKRNEVQSEESEVNRNVYRNTNFNINNTYNTSYNNYTNFNMTMPYNNSLNYNKTPFNINPTSNPQGNPQENPENKNQTNPTTQTKASPNYVNMGVNMYHPGYYNQVFVPGMTPYFYSGGDMRQNYQPYLMYPQFGYPPVYAKNNFPQPQRKNK